MEYISQLESFDASDLGADLQSYAYVSSLIVLNGYLVVHIHCDEGVVHKEFHRSWHVPPKLVSGDRIEGEHGQRRVFL